MGTNYFVVADGALGEQRLHVGKSSYGWRFLFEAHSELPDGTKITTAKDWRLAINGLTGGGRCRLEDEYGHAIDPDEFWQMVEARTKGLTGDEAYLDPEGHPFLECEFS